MPEVALFQPERLHPRGGGLPLRVARVIAQRILAGTYPADQTIPVESVLAEEFGVSRSALREAIKLLAAKGLLATRPRLGTQRSEEHTSELQSRGHLVCRLL